MSDAEYESIKRRLGYMSNQLNLMDRALRGDGEDKVGLVARVRGLELKVLILWGAMMAVAGAVVTNIVKGWF